MKLTNFLDLLQSGGRWLGAARTWMQSNAMNGEDVTWGSQDFLKLRPQTVRDIESLAAIVATEAKNELIQEWNLKQKFVVLENGEPKYFYSGREFDLQVFCFQNKKFSYKKLEALKWLNN